MTFGFSEEIVEHAGLTILTELSWLYLPGLSVAPDDPALHPVQADSAAAA